MKHEGHMGLRVCPVRPYCRLENLCLTTADDVLARDLAVAAGERLLELRARRR